MNSKIEIGKRVALFGGGGFVGVNLAQRLSESADFAPIFFTTKRMKAGDTF